MCGFPNRTQSNVADCSVLWEKEVDSGKTNGSQMPFLRLAHSKRG